MPWCPESVNVQSDGTPNGSVVTTSFLGAISRLTVAMDDRTTLVAQIPRTSVASPGPGDRVSVGIDPAAVLVVAD